MQNPSTLTPRARSRTRPALACAMLAALLAGCVVAPPPAPAPQRHPAWLHAISDLRDARWNLQNRPGGPAVSGQEDIAITEIDAAIGDARRAAAWDGKDPDVHPPEDARLDDSGRLHHALELLHKAHADVGEAEDNPDTRPLRVSVERHIDVALQATARAIQIIDSHL